MTLRAYADYLSSRSKSSRQLAEFYEQEKWRGWRFRIFCARKSSEDRMLNRISDTYGRDCTIYYGNWSSSGHQIKGCLPTPNEGTRRLISKRFNVIEVDEYKTSKVCNLCKKELKRYKKRDGRLSYSRLYCTNCFNSNGGGRENGSLKRSTRFVSRDVNAAANILLAGTSAVRPKELCRSNQQSECSTLSIPPAKKIKTHSVKRPVGAGRSSSSPSLSTSNVSTIADKPLW